MEFAEVAWTAEDSNGNCKNTNQKQTSIFNTKIKNALEKQ